MYYFEDLQVGETVDLGTVTPTQEEIIAFARQFDRNIFILMLSEPATRRLED